jgi:uncharacterized protein (DUF2252 family)
MKKKQEENPAALAPQDEPKSKPVTDVSPEHAPKVASHPSIQEREELGKATRKKWPRESHAEWEPKQDRPDPVGLLEAQATTRIPELIPIRYGRMLASPFAFYRGAAAIMASDLGTVPHTGLRVQLCGDAHISNFGGFGSPERELVLDINDFDETLPGPWEWDVKRLAASIEIAGRERNFKTKERRSLVLAAVSEYHQAMREFSAMGNLELWYLHLNLEQFQTRWKMTSRPKAVKTLEEEFAQGVHRDNQRAFEKLTTRIRGRLRIAAHPPLVVPVEDIVPDDRQAEFEESIRTIIRRYRASLQPDRRHLLENFEYVHLARKVVGVGSVGTRAWIVLLTGRDESDPLFLQVKEAQASVLEAHLSKSVYKDSGQRVVEGQRLMQAASDIFLGWEHIPLGLDDQPHDYYLRQLWDWKISADIETMTPDEMRIYGQMCGWTLARAHARSGDRVAIASYLGKNDVFENSLVEFANAYAAQNERDYECLVEAVKQKRVKAETGI